MPWPAGWAPSAAPSSPCCPRWPEPGPAFTYSASTGFSACYPGTIDGDFGTNTFGAVECFQRHNSLHIDGVVGKNTWHALMSYIAADPNNCDRQGWCNFNYSGIFDQFRMWVPTTIWYVVGLSGKFVQMNTGGPN